MPASTSVTQKVVPLVALGGALAYFLWHSPPAGNAGWAQVFFAVCVGAALQRVLGDGGRSRK